MNETKALGDIIRDQEYAAAREFIRRKYPISELDARALTEFSLERNEYFRKIAEQAQQIVTAVVNTTVMPPIIAGSAETGGENAAHVHAWKLKGQVLEPDDNGIFWLTVWDGSRIERKVPSKWSECECGQTQIAPLGRKTLQKAWRSYRRRQKRAVLAQMPYREAGEWAADLLRIVELPGESKTKKFAVEFCSTKLKTYEHKEDAEPYLKDLHRILRRKLRDYAAQEKRSLACKLGFQSRNPEPGANFRRSSQNQTVSSGVEGAHEGTTADEKGGSREPEKLNNAQKSKEFVSSPDTLSGSLRFDGTRVPVAVVTDTLDDLLEGYPSLTKTDIVKAAKYWALAESSLSSPPPEFCQCDKDWTDGTGWCQECHLERKSNGEAE